MCGLQEKEKQFKKLNIPPFDKNLTASSQVPSRKQKNQPTIIFALKMGKVFCSHKNDFLSFSQANCLHRHNHTGGVTIFFVIIYHYMKKNYCENQSIEA